ncbi:MAG: hypothetical protein DMG78_31630, partial [Acidobacteria bacterium]
DSSFILAKEFRYSLPLLFSKPPGLPALKIEANARSDLIRANQRHTARQTADDVHAEVPLRVFLIAITQRDSPRAPAPGLSTTR